jgi:ABC-type branched-subunit amino acid transport system substrate-binding protein
MEARKMRTWRRWAGLAAAAAGTAVAVGACGGGGSGTLSASSAQQGSSQSQGNAAPNGGTQVNPAAPSTGTNSGAAAPNGGTNSSAAAPAAGGGTNPGAANSAAGKGNLAPAPGLPKPGVPGAGAPPPPGANFASDVGVTATQINIGIINIASANRSLGPPIALASQHIDNALVDMINRNGGVAGRKLNLMTCDDGGDVTRARACYEKLKTQVFAFVPSETFVTDVIHDALAKDKVPWLSWGWFKSEYTDPYMFPCHANGMREASNLARWISHNRHPQTVGIMYLNVAEDIAAKDVATQVFEQNGVKVVQSIGQEWDSPDESQHVLAMRVANPDLVVTFSWPAPVAKFLHDAGAQNWAPKMGFAGNHMTGDPGYGPIFSDYIKDKYLTITSWAVPGQGNPEGNLPGNNLWEQLSAVTGKDLVGFHFKYAMGHHITQSAIACTRVLADAAAPLGANLTRTRFIQALESRSFETGFGVTLRWPHGDHGQEPYSFNKEFLYEWIGSPDGGYDLKRVLPDPVNV